MSEGQKKKPGKAVSAGLQGRPKNAVLRRKAWSMGLPEKLAGICRKLAGVLSEKLAGRDVRRLVMTNIPYAIVVYMADKEAWLYRHCAGDSFAVKAGALFLDFNRAFGNPVPSFHPFDLMAGIAGAVCVKLAVYTKARNAKKYRQGVEYGSAR